jgi:preprotein translocase subunit YajC
MAGLFIKVSLFRNGPMLDLAFAMAPPPDGSDPGGGSLLSLLPPMIMMFMIFYFVLIRPQKKKQDEARKMIDELKEGDTVVTLSGIHGTVKKLKEDTVMLQIADNVRIKINRSSIGSKKV